MLLVDDILLFPVHSILWVFREIGEIAQKELAGEAKSITEQLRYPLHATGDRADPPKPSSMPGRSFCWTGWTPSKTAWRTKVRRKADEDDGEESRRGRARGRPDAGQRETAMSRQTLSFFDKPGLQLLLFGGKGGVGKTTCATAAALRLSALAPQRSLLLVSTDPAHSVRDSLAGYLPPGKLHVLELDAQQCLTKFRQQNSGMLREIAAAGTFLDDDDINQFLSLSLPGLDELMALFEISSWVEARQYDCIVVDTAPSGHTLRLLTRCPTSSGDGSACWRCCWPSAATCGGSSSAIPAGSPLTSL